MSGMTEFRPRVVAWAMGACCAVVGAASADVPRDPVSIYSGVFTAEQADRGKAVYDSECAACHGRTGRGGPSAPPITGYVLNEKYEGVPLVSYFEFMRTTMPIARPGALQERAYADVLAYILKLQGAPAGETELMPNHDLLAGIIIERKPK